MAQPQQFSDKMANVGAQAERRLSALADYFPAPKAPPMSFDQYLPQALARAQKDEKFARELARSLLQTVRFGG